MPIELEITIEVSAMEAALSETERRIERGAVRGVGRVLSEVERVHQIGIYGPDSNPPRPAGSTYIRTFNLQRASRTRIVDRKLPNISGEWYTEGVDYDEEVLGKRANQAEIHRDRWKSEEEVVEEVSRFADDIIAEEIGKEVNQ